MRENGIKSEHRTAAILHLNARANNLWKEKSEIKKMIHPSTNEAKDTNVRTVLNQWNSFCTMELCR